MTESGAIIFAAIAGPIAAAIVGTVISRHGTKGRIDTLQHALKQLEIIEKLLTLNEKMDDGENREKLERKIQEETLHFLHGSSAAISKAHDILVRHSSRSQLYRFFFLPRPINTSGWIATVTYYIYVFSAIGLLLQSMFISKLENLTLDIISVLIILSVIFGARVRAINSIKKETTGE